MSAKLRLGPIPKAETVKLTIAVSSQLKADLDRYAEVHAQTWGDKVDVPTLVRYMLETFIARDRAFRKSSSSTEETPVFSRVGRRFNAP